VRFFADGGYSGKLQDQCFLETGALLTIAKRVTDKGFEVIPKRWIVERTFACYQILDECPKNMKNLAKLQRPIYFLI